MNFSPALRVPVDLDSMNKLFASIVLLLPIACDPGAVALRPVVPLPKARELVVLTTNSATTRYIDAQGQYSGLEYDLVQMFAREIGMKVRYLDRQPFDQILPALKARRAHFAAAGLTVTAERLQDFEFTPAYQYVLPVLAYNTDQSPPRSLKDVIGKRLEVVKGSSSVAQLQRLEKHYPGLKWSEVAESDGEGLLTRLSQGKVDFVITESHILDVVRNFYPNIGRGFNLGPEEPLAWAFSQEADPQLYQRAQEFFLRISNDHTLRRLQERYYGHVRRLNRMDITNFQQEMRTVLPRYRPMFKHAQELTGIDWRLLAALAFQESHWEPLATSPTGVRGFMMLTSETADRMGVSDRLDPNQNIVAGARYLRDLKETLPARIEEPDRTWLALAAYNVGYGHLEDARVLAQRKGWSPDLWVDVKKALPSLTDFDTFMTLKHGFARGGEALVLTENIRNYYDILRRFEAPHVPSLRLVAEDSAAAAGSTPPRPVSQGGVFQPVHFECMPEEGTEDSEEDFFVRATTALLRLPCKFNGTAHNSPAVGSIGAE